MIDLPFALPTAVAGIALSTLYAPNGWIGSLLVPHGIRIAYTPWGVLVAMIFIGLPFTRAHRAAGVERAGPGGGGSRRHPGRDPACRPSARVVLPMLMPALLTGAAMAFARGVGEYGSIIFIAGNIPAVSEIAPLLIVTKLEQFDYAGAAAIGVVMLAASFVHAAGAERTAGLGGEAQMSKEALARPTDDPLWLKALLGAVAIGFIAVLLLLPLVLVFKEAFAQGAGAFWEPWSNPTPWPRCACR